MPPTTRTTDPLQYVLESVLKATEEKDPYRLALTAAGASTIDDLLELTREDLISITWQDSDTQQEGSLPIAKVNVLLSICSWFRSQPDTSDTVFLELTAEKLKEYRRSLSHAPTAQDTASALVALSPSTSKLSPADEFKKGIKRDVNAFKPFKDRKNWNPWYRGFQAIAKAQGLGNVLDPTYEPTTPEEEALFQVLQDYTFAVFTHCLHEAQASNLVRNYSGPLAGDRAGNAQLLHMELVKLMSTGISARTQRTNIESKLMRLRLDRNWTKSINSFLVHFAHQVKDLRELRDPADASSYSDVWCMSALDTALSPHQEMSSHVSSLATSRSAIQVALGNKEQLPTLTFMEYLSQLTDHAIVLDNRNTQNSNSGPYPVRQQQRSAHSTRTSQNSAKDQHSKPAQPGMSGRNDPTDPSIWLSDREFQKLTNEQKRIRKERHRARRQQRNSASAGTATPPSHAQQVPTSIAVNATNASAAATGGPSSTPSPVSTQPASVLRNMMSTRSTRGDSSVANETITLDGVTYTRQVTATLVYQVQGQRKRATSPGALIDGGANGGLVGSDAKILETDLLNTADVVGVTDHILSSLPIVQAAAKLDTQDHGPVIGIFSSYAMRSDGGPTVHSKGQMEAFGLIVDDKSSLVGGTQCIITNEGYVVPLHIRQGLPYMPMEVPTQEEMDSLPHVFFTSDSPWDPATLDNEFPTSTCSTPEEATRRQQAMDSRVDAFGQLSVSSLRETTPISSTPALGIQAYSQEVLRQFPDLDSLRPNFGWLPRDRIKATLGATTQHYKATIHHPFRKHFKSRFPAANVRRLPEWVSTDTIFSDTPAHDDGIPGHGEQYGEQPPSHDWMHSVYGSPKEQLPPNAPEPRGNPVRTTTFVDANLMHDYSTGRSATGVLHFLNQTPIDCFSKRQSQLETATYGSEFVAARTGTEQIIDLRFTLRMLGVPLDGPSWMFGDNQSVITSSTIPHSTLSKRWNALSYHRVREAVASGILRFHFIESKQNPADILTKPLSHSAMWPHVDTLFFRKGDTASQGPPHSERGVTIGIDLRTEPNAQEAVSGQPSVRFERAKLQI